MANDHLPRKLINVDKPFRPIDFVAIRDGAKCRYCGTEDLTVLTKEHLTPLSRGGSETDLENLGVACSDCNNDKDNLTDEEYVFLLGNRQILQRYKDLLLRHQSVLYKTPTRVPKPQQVIVAVADPSRISAEYLGHAAMYTEAEFRTKISAPYPQPLNHTHKNRVMKKMQQFRAAQVQLAVNKMNEERAQ